MLVKEMLLEKIFRAYLDYTNEKYGHEHEETKLHVHDIVRCKHKSVMETMFPEFMRSPSAHIFIGEAIDEFAKKIMDKAQYLQEDDFKIILEKLVRDYLG